MESYLARRLLFHSGRQIPVMQLMSKDVQKVRGLNGPQVPRMYSECYHDQNKVKTVNHDKNITLGEYLLLYEYEAYQRHRIKS